MSEMECKVVLESGGAGVVFKLEYLTSGKMIILQNVKRAKCVIAVESAKSIRNQNNILTK